MIETNWTTKWSGEWPTLCYGHWTLYKNGEEVETDIPFQNLDANTHGSYANWFYNWELGEEDFEVYINGLNKDEWCSEYRDWLKTIAPESEWEAIYDAFTINDWRPGSCGGCL